MGNERQGRNVGRLALAPNDHAKLRARFGELRRDESHGDGGAQSRRVAPAGDSADGNPRRVGDLGPFAGRCAFQHPQSHAAARHLPGQLASGAGETPGATKIKWAPAKSYEPEDLVITRNGNLLVASYSAVVTGLTVEGKKHAEASSPRLLTYRLNEQNQWKLIALANFNTPKDLPKGTTCPAGNGG